MIGKLKDIIFTRGGEQIVSFTTRSDFTEAFDELKDFEVDITIKKLRKKRSLDANAYSWVLIDKIAETLSLTREEVYREAIRNIGGVSEIVCVREEAFDRLKAIWGAKGIGWQVDQMPSKLPGCVIAILYQGSSSYDTKQMSALIDQLIQDAQALGIPTATPDEIENLKSLWANAPAERKNNG